MNIFTEDKNYKNLSDLTYNEEHTDARKSFPVTVRNPSVSLSPTLTRNEKVEHYIRIKTPPYLKVLG